MALANRNILLQTTSSKFALVIDDVSNISNLKEKEATKSLVKINNKYKLFPIIIITNTRHNKMVNELKKMITYTEKEHNEQKQFSKMTNEIILHAPDTNDLEAFINKICDGEGLNIVNGECDIISEIINHSQFDIRRLINILEELHMLYGTSTISDKEFQLYCDISKIKDIDPGIFEATGELLNDYTSINESLDIYSEERATIPLIVHENYMLNIKRQYPNMTTMEQIDTMFIISQSISESDRVDGLIYSNQCWNLQSVHGFYSCVMPSYYINKTPGKLHTSEKYRYTKDYNKTSIKKINNKVIKKAQENPFFKEISIIDFSYIANIFRTLIEEKKFDKVVEIAKPYGLSLKEIESIIKIDKINKQKTTLNCKQRNLIKDKLEQ